MLVHDIRNPRAVALAEQVLAAAPDLAERDDLTAVLGGDGFLLHTVHKYGFERRYLPLNAGTLGFMLNEVRGRVDDVADLIAREAFREYRFPLLAAKVICTDGRTVTDHAMNDVYLERDSGQTARLSIDLEGLHFPEQLSADGLILATALGSTAYSFSAGGVPCEPGLPVLCVTPICPHTPRLSPFIVRYGARASIDVLHADRRPVRVVIDGRDVAGVQRLEVGPTDATVRMVYFDGHQFTSEMVTKLLT